MREEHVSDFDITFAQFMEELGESPSEELFLAACLVSHHIAQGHICVDLKKYSGQTLFFPEAKKTYLCPPFETWWHILSQSPVVGTPFSYRPLILDGHLIYLYRYWRYERSLAEHILKKGQEKTRLPDPARLRNILEQVFASSRADETDWLQVAAFMAARKKLTFISGGPGTGKTYLTARIVALFHELQSPQSINIALAAPTGKAAARLQETLREAKSFLPDKEISAETFTLHRLLKMRPHKPASYYSPSNPLPYDVVILDEASMVDLPLFSRLLSALREDTRIILLGDKDQLASVEAGAVFGELCSAAERSGYSDEFASECLEVTGQGIPVSPTPGRLSDSLVVLKKNFRFSPASAIHQAAEAVKEGNGTRFLEILKDQREEVEWRIWQNWTHLTSLIEDIVTEGYAPYLKAASAEETFHFFNQFRVLCAIREGPFGVENMNRLIEYILAKRGYIVPFRPWYEKMPIMVTKNDYGLLLMNGDCGIILRDKKANRLVAFFPEEMGGFKSFHPGNLPTHEPVFAMTVHKSQGSEFDRILLILPDRATPVLSRELLYTAITRAKRKITIIGSEVVLIDALNHKTERTSGLTKLL
ncbi:MAG: exodeoxyribonuclease V subunit alpha [Syntrophales bacterium]|nr:exodeoxyribonuclease V subunit alpha [Syntrophales bacterium]